VLPGWRILISVLGKVLHLPLALALYGKGSLVMSEGLAVPLAHVFQGFWLLVQVLLLHVLFWCYLLEMVMLKLLDVFLLLL